MGSTWTCGSNCSHLLERLPCGVVATIVAACLVGAIAPACFPTARFSPRSVHERPRDADGLPGFVTGFLRQLSGICTTKLFLRATTAGFLATALLPFGFALRRPLVIQRPRLVTDH